MFCATGHILSIYDSLTAAELVMLIKQGGTLPLNATRRRARMIEGVEIYKREQCQQTPKRIEPAAAKAPAA